MSRHTRLKPGRPPRIRMGWRLDHIFARGLRVTGCDYRHDWRERGLSDHSGMWAALEPE